MSTPLQSSESNQDQPQIVLTSAAFSAGQCTYLNDSNKAFDDVVFDILKVDPDDIAGQMTLIDLPLFKAIEPDELISCKWMSREKLIKAPNIVQFTRRFNQTTFWCQKEILNCKRIETRAKMLTHFIKICKRLNELHSFNSLMAIIVALKSAPIYRLKKTWSHVSKRDLATFERLADLMFDTSDNKRKIRDMHMNCKLPCIPFLGLFLTDLIHIDIAHPHNSFDNPQRRNQMNNICRLISEYQQSNYQDLTSISCLCELNSSETCLTPNCQCALHHGNGYAGGLINSDGTIYINEIKYVKNYLNSFLYIEELQKFKEDENYRDSLELEPDPEVISHLPEKQTSPLSTSSPSKQNLENNLIKPVINLNNVNSNNNNNKLVNPLDDSLVIDNNLIHFNLNEFNELSKEEQKKILNNVKLTDPPSNLLKELLKHRHQNTTLTNKPSLRHKFSCYSSSTADLDDDEDLAEASLDDSSYINELTPVKNNTQLDRLGLTPSTGRNLSTDFGIDQLDSSETSSLQCPNGQIILFESPIKRKCIIKNFRKPRFSQWKSYWLQLVGGNLLIYYPAKTSLIFSKDSRRSSVISSEDLNSTESLKNQVQNKKVFYNKNPCKMHPIANWMVVNLFDDRKEQEENKNGDLSTCEKYDIQLNDLNNGNMYKYRFDSLDLAKEWLEQFKMASTFHERQKPDNLIRFD